MQKKKLSVSTVSLTVILTFIVSLMPAAMLVYTETKEDQFSVKINFDEPTYTNVQVQGNNYDKIQLGDCSYLSEVRKPMLPAKGALILLPPKMDVESVNVVPVEFETLPGQFDVYPAQPPATVHNSPSFVKPDRTAYASTAPYPSKWYDQEMVLSFRGYQLLYLRLYPVRYIGANRQIRFCREMEITVTVSSTEFMTEHFEFHEMGLRNSRPEIDEWISEYILNPEMMMQYEAALSTASEPSPPPVVDYLIVTRDTFLDVLTTYPTSTTNGSSLFIRSKKFAGLHVAVETLEDIRTQYVGYDDAEEIRECIQHYYTTYGLTFVLLLGDVENSTADWYVPVRNMYNPDGESTWTPSDFYYAGLDGTWDADGDHIYGERWALSTEDEADWSPEVYVGRITAKTAAELETQLNKIANFKGFSDSSITNMLLCGSIMNPDTDEKPLKEYVRDNFIPSSVTVSELYESVGTLTENNFTEVVNTKRPEVINTASHGWYTSLSPGYFSTSTTPDLMKGPLYLWYACACLAGAFDYSSDCCGEVMMKDPDGGGMFIGASRETWLYNGYPTHLNGLWGKQDWLFWQHFFQYKMYDPGSCLYNSKMTYISGGPDLQWEIERKNLFAMNLLGDPQARATCAKRGKILFDESHDGGWLIEKGGLYYDLAVALRSVGYTVDSLQVHYGPSATIDFDDLAHLENVERHYPGLNFSPGYAAFSYSYYPPHSTPNVAYTHETSNYIVFDVPVQSVGAYFSSPDSYNIAWNAYDRADNLLSSVSIPADAENVYRSIFDPQGRIRKLVVTGTVSDWNYYWSIDDLNYTSNVYIETMRNYDTLVLIPGHSQIYYSSLEVNYTKSFVSSRGGLCIIGEHKDWMAASHLNLISSHYGVTFQENVFSDPTNYDVYTTYALVHTFPAAGDPTYGILVKGLNTVLYPSGCSLSVSSPATAVATGDDDSYTTGSSYESLMAAATSGDGRVFCVGDANIWDKQDFPGNGAMHLYQQDNLYLMYNVFDWLTGNRATRSVSILIDQKHSASWSVYYGDPSSYSGLCDHLRHDNYGVYTLKTDPITYSKLADYDIFVLPLPMSSFSTSEIDAIKQFVNEGGHLWVIGDAGTGYGTVPNQVSSEFDIEFDMNWVTDPTDYQVSTIWVFYYGRNFVHQTTHCLTKLESYHGASLTLYGSASSAINTDSDASPASKSVMAVNTYGDGRVVVMGDSNYFGNNGGETDGICCIDEADNAKLALRVVSWAPCLETYQFPSPTSTICLADNSYMWLAGDYIEESFTWSHSLPAIQLVIHFEVNATPGLNDDGYIPMDVLVDGTKVGEFIITRGHYCIDKTFTLIPYPINQGSFTVKYLETRTVDAGKGSVQIDTTNSYIRLASVPELQLQEVIAWYWVSDTKITSVVEGDVDSDGSPEIVTGGYYYDDTREVAQLAVWNGSTLELEGVTAWYWTGNTTITSVAIEDVDGDSQVEIVTAGCYHDGFRKVAQLAIWDGATLSLENVKTWYWVGDTCINCVAIGDIDYDGTTEIITGGYHNDGTRNVAQLAVWDGQTLSLEGVTFWYWVGDTRITSVAIGDVEEDALNEIVTGGYYYDGAQDVAQLAVWNSSTLKLEGVTAWYWVGDTRITSVAVGDVDGDGSAEIVTGGYYHIGVKIAQLATWDGATLSSENVTVWYWTGDTYITSVAIGDIDGDGDTEIVTGGSYHDGTYDFAQLIVWDGSDLTLETVTVWCWVGDTRINSVAVRDVDGDGVVEIVTGGSYYDGTRTVAQLTVWSVISG